MIKISAVEIFNYRSCLSTKVDLSKNLMCLIGINGAGKTNILNAILLLKKTRSSKLNYQTQSEPIQGASTKISIRCTYDEKPVNINFELKYETDDKNHDEVLGGKVKFNLKAISGKNRWLELPIEFYNYLDNQSFIGVLLRQKAHQKNKPTEKEIQIIADFRRCLQKISYYSASQFSDPSKSPISLELDEAKPTRQYRNSPFHEKFLHDLYITSKNDENLFAKYLNTVNRMGMGIIDNIAFSEYEMPSSSYEVKSGGKIKKIEKNRKLVIPYINIENTQLSPNQLSEGTYRTLALAFYIITDDNDLLIIEEPEVCVHHGLLDSIISLIEMQAKNKQIIISTHSDFILDKLMPENILIVKKSPNIGTTCSNLAKSLTRNDYKALKKYLAESGNLGEYWKEGGFEHE